MKKVVSILLSMVMVISVSLPANAAEKTYADLPIEDKGMFLREKKGDSAIDRELESAIRNVTSNGATIIAEDEVTVYVGGTSRIHPYSTAASSFSYTSNDTRIATVESDGTVSGVSEGVTVIFVRAAGCQTKIVTVYVIENQLEQPEVSIGRNADGITVMWNEIDGADEYDIYRKVGSGNYWELLNTTANHRYVDRSLTWGSRHYYKVKARGTVHSLERESEYSDPVARTVDSLYAPATLTVKRAGLTSIKLTWTRSYPAKGYVIYRATSKSGTYKKVKTITSGSTLSYTNTGLKTGQKYYYKVRATYGSKYSGYTSAQYATPTPSAPKMKTTAYSTSKTIKVQWDKVSSVSGYYVYRRTSSSSGWKYIGKVKSGSTVSFTDKSASGAYDYAVKSYKVVSGKNVYSSLSNTIKCRTLKTTTVHTTCDTDSLTNTLTWNKISGATSYQIYRKIGSSGSWEYQGAVAGDVTEYTGSVPHGYYIYWKIRPVSENNGVKTYGSYCEGDDCWIVYYYPNYSVLVSKETNRSASVMVIAITNNGVGKMRVYSSNARYTQPSPYTSFNRKLYLIDEAALDAGKIKKVSYVDIAPNKTEFLIFVVDGSRTWYDSQGSIWYDFRYDGMNYRGRSSAYYGSQYTKK